MNPWSSELVLLVCRPAERPPLLLAGVRTDGPRLGGLLGPLLDEGRDARRLLVGDEKVSPRPLTGGGILSGLLLLRSSLSSELFALPVSRPLLLAATLPAGALPLALPWELALLLAIRLTELPLVLDTCIRSNGCC